MDGDARRTFNVEKSGFDQPRLRAFSWGGGWGRVGTSQPKGPMNEIGFWYLLGFPAPKVPQWKLLWNLLGCSTEKNKKGDSASL